MIVSHFSVGQITWLLDSCFITQSKDPEKSCLSIFFIICLIFFKGNFLHTILYYFGKKKRYSRRGMREEKEMGIQSVGMNDRSGVGRQISDVSYRGRIGFVKRRESKTVMAEIKGWIYGAGMKIYLLSSHKHNGFCVLSLSSPMLFHGGML